MSTEHPRRAHSSRRSRGAPATGRVRPTTPEAAASVTGISRVAAILLRAAERIANEPAKELAHQA